MIIFGSHSRSSVLILLKWDFCFLNLPYCVFNLRVRNFGQNCQHKKFSSNTSHVSRPGATVFFFPGYQFFSTQSDKAKAAKPSTFSFAQKVALKKKKQAQKNTLETDGGRCGRCLRSYRSYRIRGGSNAAPNSSWWLCFWSPMFGAGTLLQL